MELLLFPLLLIIIKIICFEFAYLKVSLFAMNQNKQNISRPPNKSAPTQINSTGKYISLCGNSQSVAPGRIINRGTTMPNKRMFTIRPHFFLYKAPKKGADNNSAGAKDNASIKGAAANSVVPIIIVTIVTKTKPTPITPKRLCR